MNELSEYELKRLENIRRNEAVLAALNLPTFASAAPPPKRKLTVARKNTSPVRKKRASKVEQEPASRRKSARLRGEKADLSLAPTIASGAADLALTQSGANLRREHAHLRERIEGDVALAQTAAESGSGGQRRFAKLLESIAAADLGPKREVAADALHEVDALRDIFSRLAVQHAEEGTVKVTPERIYCTAFHPSDKLLVAAGDKNGTLGFWDVRATLAEYGVEDSSVPTTKQEEDEAEMEADEVKVKLENDDEDKENKVPRRSNRHVVVEIKTIKAQVADDGDLASEELEDRPDPVYTYRPHAGTIAAMRYTPDGSRLFTSSYDGTVRYLDLASQHFMEAYAYTRTADNPYAPRDMLIGSLDLDPGRPDLLWFSTNDGDVGRRDLRVPINEGMVLYPLLQKKIGCLSINPGAGRHHLLATASLDRVLRIWDARKLSAVADEVPSVTSDGPLLAEFAHGKSVTSAYWSPSGDHLVSTSYDDTLRIFSPSFDAADTKTLAPLSLNEPLGIHHNCQTGRWLTMLRANWARPLQHPTFVIGNMRRTVDLFSGVTGELLWTLTAPDIVTAVPAVTAYHPSRHAVVGGNGSGRMLVWS
ncbi:WD40-repeat-containing domain protein [Thamnocephalis sphaerospora]|uniref:DNA damage-binding protein CMR1 n=1 Tax=Thamnocephalis sphaerospora TaxID=78915 RepID=A0A4P9Y094_9FUNG|nr:WD40-repeat-containing domain protein [Thamnocephalis sphaerospora]|eukprot:RKP11180.1 WD40-repeat-containing domain protein [Thamnocephalis sphaerospora]